MKRTASLGGSAESAHLSSMGITRWGKKYDLQRSQYFDLHLTSSPEPLVH